MADDPSPSNLCEFMYRLHLPLPAKPRQAGRSGEELLHGGLFEVALLGDELVELGEQRIHIGQRGGDSALFREGWSSISKINGITNVELFLRSTVLHILNLFESFSRVHHIAKPM